MSQRLPQSRRKKRIGLLLLFIAGLLCLIAVLPNLIFLTQWGRGFITRRIEHRTNLSTEVAHLSWAPWKGFVAKEISLKTKKSKALPKVKTLCTVQSVQVTPHWEALLKGGIDFREIHLHEVSGELPIEALAEVLKPSPQKVRPRPTPPSILPENAPAKKSADLAEKSPSKQAPPKEPASPSVQKPSTKPTRPPAGKKTTLRITDSTFTLYSLKNKFPPMQVKKFNADIPLRGEDRAGRISLLAATLLEGQEVSQKMTFPLQWTRPFLTLAPTILALQENKFLLEGRLNLHRQPACRMTLQNAPETTSLKLVYPSRHLTCQTGPFHLSAKFEGSLRNPNSWRGNLVTQAQDVSLSHLKKGELYVFEQSHAVVSYAKGVLQIPSARLFSEDFSLTANGYANAQPDAKAVVRLVAAPNKVPTLRKLWRGGFWEARKIGTPMYGELFPEFETPDRFYRDFEVELQPQTKAPLINLGRDGAFIPLQPILENIRKVVKTEDAEEFPTLVPQPISPATFPLPKAQKAPPQTLPKKREGRNPPRNK